VQGRLRGEKLRVHINSECRHCSRRLVLEVDDELDWYAVSAGATPLLFMPDIKWKGFRGANIIHDY
jgi:hypothetical protein